MKKSAISSVSDRSVKDTWVTYKTSHPSGFYYLGKSSVRRIQAGYQGSGPKFKCVQFHPGYEPATWTTEIVSTWDTEADAYAAEALLVPLNTLIDPFCLNTSPGGKTRMYGSPYTKIVNSFKVKRAPKVKVKKTPKGFGSQNHQPKGLKK